MDTVYLLISYFPTNHIQKPLKVNLSYIMKWHRTTTYYNDVAGARELHLDQALNWLLKRIVDINLP